MAKFLKGNELNFELEKMFENAQSQLILISPYIKLHDRFISPLRTKLNNPNLEITIVFGKNEEDMSKSMKFEDFSFFKEFPNIEIRYEKSLHAKYYANESSALLTSMNLYSYSQDHNIEAGILTKITLLGNLTNNLISNVTGEDSLDAQAFQYFTRVIDQSDLLYKREPIFENKLMGLSKKYMKSKVEIDKLSEFFAGKIKSPVADSNYVPPKQFETSKQNSTSHHGFCIRTGKPIRFNPSAPLSDEAYKSWARYKKDDFPENFCHFSGEESNGETSYAYPILYKNWKVAQGIFNL